MRRESTRQSSWLGHGWDVDFWHIVYFRKHLLPFIIVSTICSVHSFDTRFKRRLNCGPVETNSFLTQRLSQQNAQRNILTCNSSFWVGRLFGVVLVVCIPLIAWGYYVRAQHILAIAPTAPSELDYLDATSRRRYRPEKCLSLIIGASRVFEFDVLVTIYFR
jgi:hypothetical protein